jgi:Zn-dependent protease
MLGGLFYLLWAAAVGWPALSAVLAYLAVVNLLLALFNIIPGVPLDGGRVLRAFLWWKTADLKRSTVLAARVGAGVGWALVAAGLLLFFGDPVGGAWLILIGLFLRSAANFSSERAERGQEV